MLESNYLFALFLFLANCDGKRLFQPANTKRSTSWLIKIHNNGYLVACTDDLSGWGFNPTKTTDPNESVKHEYGTMQSNHFWGKFCSHSKLDFLANLSFPDTIISPKPHEHRNKIHRQRVSKNSSNFYSPGQCYQPRITT